jgi:uncharacterized membrane protein YhaH (DUF805 family)
MSRFRVSSSDNQRTWPWLDLIRLDGRASRDQWWLPMILTNATISLLLIPSLDTSSSSPPTAERFAESSSTQPSILIGFLDMTVFALYLALMSAVSVRRLHDRNKSGSWVLLYFVPVIGQVWLFLELGVLAGTRGPNRFG